MSPDMALQEPDHQRRLGARLRGIRHQQGMSLAEVQTRSGGRWKAVVVGAYERGDRTITVAKLSELARFYGVPLADLLPSPATHEEARGERRYVLDLAGLRQATAAGHRELLPVARFAAHIRRHRGDHNGRVLTIRASDVDMLALTTGQDPDELVERMRREGALRDVG
jgi:transcriptional regulator with XRE-family HTH domain